MKNLAGETKADLHILEELSEAGIEVVEGEAPRGEVPHTLTGRLADWNFSRAWYYWIASAKEGLPLEVATELHNREYAVKGEGQHKTYGQAIRVVGHCGCPHPEEWAFPKEEIYRKQLEDLGKDSVTYGELADLCNKGTIKGARFVDSYHVDSQEGLNALAGAIRTLHNIASSGTDSREILRLYDKISALYTEWETENKQEGIEWLKKMPTILYDNGRTVNELIVVIKDDSEVVSIAKRWKDKEHSHGGIAQHFFEGGQITSFNYGNLSGPGQILNRGPEVDGMLRPHYEEVKQLRPKAAESLELCMQALERPGPGYTGRSDGGMTVKLAQR